jgi:hypothetical protein
MEGIYDPGIRKRRKVMRAEKEKEGFIDCLAKSLFNYREKQRKEKERREHGDWGRERSGCIDINITINE